VNNKKLPISTVVYLIRHATPDWNATHIPYDIPPGPSLVHQGEVEASQLGTFLKQTGIKKLYYSPLERAKRTAEISADIAEILIEQEDGIAEWRTNEDEPQFSSRFFPVWNKAVEESKQLGPIGLITHGGPVQFMLKILGLPQDILESYRNQFDHRNPLPPAGVWKAEKSNNVKIWDLSLVFTPDAITTTK
jgi:broad specificity phosphatase PhoE